eukprot:1370143-Amphidinium_carterae.1
MPPKPVRRRPAGRLPAPCAGTGSGFGATSIWEQMERWQEGKASLHVASLLAPGHILEIVTVSTGGRTLGHAMLRVGAIHPVDNLGVPVEVENCGASNHRMQAWIQQAFLLPERPIVHLCVARQGCRFCAGQRFVIHVPRWRVRNPLKIRETWFAPPRETEQDTRAGAGGGVLDTGAGVQPLGVHGARDGDAELLERFETMRRGGEMEVPPGEREAGRREIREALEKEELAARAQRTTHSTPNQVLVDRAVAVSGQATDEQRGRGKKRKRHSRRSSSSDSGSLRLLDRGGDNRIARVAEEKPGHLSRETLKKMRSYLSLKDESTGSQGEDPWRPVVTSYLNTILLPSTDVSLRNVRELVTIARCADCLLRGQIHQSLDVMLQRFKAVETAHFEASWSQAKHLELIPDSRVSAVPARERRAAAASERADMKTSKSLVVSGASSFKGGVAKGQPG